MPDTPIEPTPRDRYPGDMESRVTVLEQIARNTAAALERIERRLDGFDLRFEAIDRRFEAMERQFDAADRRFEAIERRVNLIAATQRADLRWLLGVMFAGFSATIAGFATMLGVMAHGFHWL